jgi:hypothetical protein
LVTTTARLYLFERLYVKVTPFWDCTKGLPITASYSITLCQSVSCFYYLSRMDLGYFMCSMSSPFDNFLTDTSSLSPEESSNNNNNNNTAAGTATSPTLTCRRPPELLDSSYSSCTSLQDLNSISSVPPSHPIVKPGETSPSSLLLNRRLSTAIVTNENHRHPVVEGRPVIVTQTLSANSMETSSVDDSSPFLTSPTRKNNRQMKISFAPRSTPGRPEHLSNRCVSEKLPSPLSMVIDHLPFTDAKQQEESDKVEERLLEEKKTEEVSSSSRPFLRRSQTEPVERRPNTYRFIPPPLRTQAWSEPPAETFNVRGKNYMNDRVKVPSQPSAFRLFAVDLVNTEEPIYSGMCAHPEERVQQALQRELEKGIKELPDFIFCVNLCVPGSINYHNVYYFGADNVIMEEIRTLSTPFGRLMHKFLYGDSDEFRNRTFKLIPRIVEGNYIVRRAVGSKPTLLGRKIKQYYIKTDRYMEVIVDIASDQIAQRVTKLCMGYLQSITVDMMFLLEGTREEELPERIFGGARLNGVDFKERDGKRTVPLVD